MDASPDIYSTKNNLGLTMGLQIGKSGRDLNINLFQLLHNLYHEIECGIPHQLQKMPIESAILNCQTLLDIAA